MILSFLVALCLLSCLPCLVLLGVFDAALTHLHQRLLSGQALPPSLAPPLLPIGACPAAFLVLGTALLPDGSPSLALRERVAAGAHAYLACASAGRSPLLLFSGGVPAGHARSEAQAMAAHAQALLRLSAQPTAWLLEGASRTTHENAVLSLALLRAANASTIAVVTSPYHQLRAYRATACAAGADGGLGLFVLPVPRAHPTAPAERAARALEAAREALALLYYFARGRLLC